MPVSGATDACAAFFFCWGGSLPLWIVGSCAFSLSNWISIYYLELHAEGYFRNLPGEDLFLNMQ
jgi:hypothetical protein